MKIIGREAAESTRSSRLVSCIRLTTPPNARPAPERLRSLPMRLLNNADKSLTAASVFMHEDKLYISEGTVPAGYPEPGLFYQSLGFLDENGNGIRYLDFYHNGFPKPGLQGGGGGAAPAGGGQGNRGGRAQGAGGAGAGRGNQPR